MDAYVEGTCPVRIRFATIVAMDEAQLNAELRTLDADARLVLAAFAVVGRASLTSAELSEITGSRDVGPAVAELERRRLVVREHGDRLTLSADVQGRVRRALASADVVDRVLRALIHIAEDGRLAIDDLDAVLELTRLAAETGRWAELLRLAEAAETTLSTTHRVDDWVEIVERRLEAARALGDADAARRAETELARLARMAGPTTVAATSGAASSGGGLRTALAILGAAALATIGVAVGYLVGDRSGAGDTVTETEATTETATVTEGGGTVTETETVTDGATETITETETVTETETETVTVTEQPVG